MNMVLAQQTGSAGIGLKVLPWFEMTDLRPEKGDMSHFGDWAIPEHAVGCICNQSIVTIAVLEIIRHLVRYA